MAAVRFTRVLMTDADGMITIGPAVPVTTGEERLGDPDMQEVIRAGASTAQWTLPDGALSTVPGPIPGKNGVSFRWDWDLGHFEVRGARIPVKAGVTFVQSAWLCSGADCSWGRHYLDVNGKELGTTASQAPYSSPGWTLVEQRLVSMPNIQVKQGRPRIGEMSGWTSEGIPIGTAYIEPFLRMGADTFSSEPNVPARWAGLSLREIPPVDGETKAKEELAKGVPSRSGSED